MGEDGAVRVEPAGSVPGKLKRTGSTNASLSPASQLQLSFNVRSSLYTQIGPDLRSSQGSLLPKRRPQQPENAGQGIAYGIFSLRIISRMR